MNTTIQIQLYDKGYVEYSVNRPHVIKILKKVLKQLQNSSEQYIPYKSLYICNNIDFVDDFKDTPEASYLKSWINSSLYGYYSQDGCTSYADYLRRIHPSVTPEEIQQGRIQWVSWMIDIFEKEGRLP
jgi:hypothetical protein